MPDGLSDREEIELLAHLEAELASRASRSLRDYVRYVPIPGVPINEGDPECEEFYPDAVVPAEHHQLILNTLDRVVLGEIKRVMIFMPPGSAKSSYASVVFPPYFMGRRPGSSIIALSYGDELAKKFGRRCRSVARSREYAQVFGHSLNGDNKAVDDWSITNGSQYMCTGALGAVTGNRADGMVFDDLIRGREDADSQTIRDKVFEAYKSDHRTRLKPKGWIVYIGTRWHEDDPAGRILPMDYDGRSGWVTARDGEQWFVINIPAQCEREDDPIKRKVGEYLWTEWFSVEHWEQEKVSQGQRNWSALYQQRPTPETGTYFQKEWLRYYTAVPAFLKVYMAADYAVTAKGGDYTVLTVFGIDHQENIYILDVWRAQASSDVWVEAVCDLVLKYHPIELIEEKGQIEKGVGPFLAKRQAERKAFCAHKLYASAADKATRAQPIRGRMAQGKVYVPDPGLAPQFHKENPCNWVEPLIYEVVRFRGVGDEIDDQVDTLSLIGRRLAELAVPSVPVTEEERQRAKLERMREVAKERPTWNGVVDDMDRRDSRQRGRIS
jgi:predicted phage terminase large subunit-like protein